MPLDRQTFLGGNGPAAPAATSLAKLNDTPRAAPINRELGVSGAWTASGQILEPVPALRDVTGRHAQWLYAEMAATDPTVAASISAILHVIMGIGWRVEPADDGPEAAGEADFVEGLLGVGGKPGDMSHSWQDALGDALTMIVYGWSYLEVVYKRRVGPGETDPARGSRFSDGRIGVRKLAGRHQLTFLRWVFDDAGGVRAMVQQPPNGGQEIVIPIERALLFRTSREMGSPEGRSLLRSSVRPWGEKVHIGRLEVTGIDRDLTGLPRMRVPQEVMEAETPKMAAVKAAAERLVEDVRFGRRSGVCLSSEPYRDADGKPTGTFLWDLDTMGSPGQRVVDVDKAQSRRAYEMAAGLNTEWKLLGQQGRGGGGRAQSEDQTDFFDRSIEFLCDQVAEPINMYLLPRLWALNGLPPETMPRLEHDPVSEVSLNILAANITALAGAGAAIGSDLDVVNAVLRRLGLPEMKEIDPRAMAPLPGEEPPPDQAAPPSDGGAPDVSGGRPDPAKVQS